VRPKAVLENGTNELGQRF